MRIKLTINDTELTGTLGNGPAARDFATLLPLTAAVSVASASPTYRGL
jgi:hypothetical protein